MTKRRYPTALLAILLWSVLSSGLFFVSTVLAADATATGSSYYDVLEVDPKADANWSFAPLADTSVLFETGPKAAEYIDDVKGVDIAPAGEGADGFALFELKL